MNFTSCFYPTEQLSSGFTSSHNSNHIVNSLDYLLYYYLLSCYHKEYGFWFVFGMSAMKTHITYSIAYKPPGNKANKSTKKNKL